MPSFPSRGNDDNARFDFYSEAAAISKQLEELLASQGQSANWCRLGISKPEFNQLSFEEQRVFLERFRFFAEICSDSVKSSGHWDEGMLIWSAFRKLRVHPPSDLLLLLGPQDYIEIYDRDGIQVFRNLEFCKLITYTLGEILIYSWPELYRRSANFTEQIMSAFVRTFDEKRILVGPDLGIDTHVCEEHRSKSGRQFEVEMKYFSPLYSEASDVTYMLAGSRIVRVK